MEKFKEDIARIEAQNLTFEEYVDAVAWANEAFNKRLYATINTPFTERDDELAQQEYLSIINNSLE